MHFFSSFDKDQLKLARKWSLYVAKVPASHCLTDIILGILEKNIKDSLALIKTPGAAF